MALFAAVVVVVFFGPQYIIYEATLIAIYGVVISAQDLVLGRAGVVSLGAAAIMAIGAFTTARLSTVTGWNVFPIPLVVSFVFGAVVGLIIGIPGLRFKGLYLMLTTLALQFVVAFAAQSYQGTNNEAGFIVQGPKWGSLNLANPRPFFVVCIVVLAITMAALAGVYRGVPGRAWSAIRQNEGGASTLGVNPVRWKLTAFIVSSAVTAVGGSLYAYQVGQVSYTSYTLDFSLVLIVMVFIGGVRSIVGPLLGGFVLVVLPNLVSEFGRIPSMSSWMTTNGGELSQAIFGLLLLVVLVFEGGGLWVVLKRLGNLVMRVPTGGRTQAESGRG
jgi:branched-chain amino acid transport system permease protein